MSAPKANIDIDRSVGDFHYKMDYEFDAGTGLTEKTIDYIVDVKGEPDWVREFRKQALRVFHKKPMPTHWASADLNNIVFDNIRYYLSSGTTPKRNWEDVPDEMKKTFHATKTVRSGRAVRTSLSPAIRSRTWPSLTAFTDCSSRAGMRAMSAAESANDTAFST